MAVDALDTILFDAWNRMSKRVRDNRIMALRRSRRRFKGVLTRPMGTSIYALARRTNCTSTSYPSASAMRRSMVSEWPS